MIPAFENCLVCDQVRPELGGKLIVLGFLGICPHVNVGVARLDQPTALTFLIMGPPGDGSFSASFDIFDESQRCVVASSAPAPFAASPAVPTTLASTLLVVFFHPGPFAVRCMVDDVERFRAQFRVSHGAAQPAPRLAP